MHQNFIDDTAPHLDAIAKQAFKVLAGMAPNSSVENNQKPECVVIDAWVSYKGGQETPSTLLITTNARFALEFSQRFLGLPSLTELDDDVLDAMGELVNTVGGNFKGLLSVDTILSTPVVSRVNQKAELYPAGSTLAEFVYAFESEGLCLVKLLGPNDG